MAEVALGHWPLLDKLLRTAEARADFTADLRAQATLLHALSHPSHGYYHLPIEHRQEMLSRLISLIPRVADSPEPRRVLEALFRLWLTPDPHEQISRALKVTNFQPRALLPEEKLYPQTGLLGMFTTWARECDVPVSFLFWSGVACIAAACRYNFFIDRGNDNLRMQQYILLVGNKGTGKTVGLGACAEILIHLNGQLWGWRLGTEGPWKATDAHPFSVRFLPTDTNQVALTKALRSQRFSTLSHYLPDLERTPEMGTEIDTDDAGFLGIDELATFFGKDNWAVSKNVPFLNAIYGDRPYVYETGKGGKITLFHNALTLLGCVQPEVMQSALSPFVFQSGFMDRCTVVYREEIREKSYPTPLPRDPLKAAEIAAHLLPLTARVRREEMLATESGNAWYEDWYREQRDPEDPREHSLHRRANHVWKLAGILSLSEGHAPWIHAEDFQLATRIYAEEDIWYRRLLGIIEQAPEIGLMDHIELMLLRAGAVEPHYLPKHELFRRLRYKRGLSPPTVKAVPLLESLEASGRIRHLLQVGKPPFGEAYQLTQEAALDLRGKTPTVLRALPAPHPPEGPDPPETACLESEAGQPAPGPAPEREQA